MTRKKRDREAAAATGDAKASAGRIDKGRFSSRKKLEAVMRLLRGEDLDLVSREIGVSGAKLSEWRDVFLVGAQNALRSRHDDETGEASLVKRLQAKLGELVMDNELLLERAQRAEGPNGPFGPRRSRS
jgi:transposase